MNKTVKWILIGVGIVAVFLVVAKVMAGSSGSEVKVTVEKVSKKTIVETVNASGKVYPEIEVKISSDVSGEITELNVQEGDSVVKGQLLARIYADIYASQRDEASARVAQSQATVANSQASLGALKAQLDQDKTAYDRNKGLYDQKVISKAEFEQFETKYRASQAQYNAALQNIRSLSAGVTSAQTQLSAANKNLGRTTIMAPMSGIISMLGVKKGERVVGTAQMTGTEMMRVANMNALEVRVDVGENDIVKVSIGDSADVEVDAYNNRKFKGVVTQIAASTLKTGSSTTTTANDVTNYEVHIRLDPSSYADLVDPKQPKKLPFRPGMNASADIKTSIKTNVIAIPIIGVAARDLNDENGEKKKDPTIPEDEMTTTVPDELKEVVFILNKEGNVEMRTVKTGIQDINNIEILSGLKEGEEVVTAPYNAITKTLKTGTKVKVVTKDKLFEK
jgi:HlyD family secretion protein